MSEFPKPKKAKNPIFALRPYPIKLRANQANQVKIYSKSVSLWVKNAVEVDMIKIESKLRAH